MGNAENNERSFETDATGYPLVVRTVYGTFTSSEVKRLEKEVLLLLARGPIMISVIDVRTHARSEAKVRAELGKMIARLDERGRKELKLSVLVVRNVLIRGTLTAINWIHPNRRPQTMVSSLRQAADICERALREQNIPMTSEVQRKLLQMRSSEA